MKLSRILIAVPVAALAACGASDPFLGATPSYAGLAMDQTSGDAVAPSAAASPLTVAGSQALMTADSPCHPHLFIRSHEAVARVNRNLFRFLRLVDYVLDRKPQVAAETAGPSACDPALNPPDGTVTDLASSADDFEFAQVTFTTGVDLTDPANQPYPFPGM